MWCWLLLRDRTPSRPFGPKEGAHIFGVCNVVGSIARETDAGATPTRDQKLAWRAPRRSRQVAVLTAMARTGRRLAASTTPHSCVWSRGFDNIPGLVEQCLESAPAIEEIAKLFAGALTSAGGHQFLALEGALKPRNRYIHAEGYPAAEMKHGPIALIDEDMPVIFIATQDEVYEKVVSNIKR